MEVEVQLAAPGIEGTTCAVSSGTAVLLERLACALQLPKPTRPRVEGEGICLGLCSPPAPPSVQTMNDAAHALLEELNDLFRRASEATGVPTWTSIQVNRSTISAWRTGMLHVGGSMNLVLGSFSWGGV